MLQPPAIASETAGQLTQGTSLETPARIGAAVVGAGLPAGLSRVISPVTAKNIEAVSTLENAGVTALSAGQKTGNKAVQYAESHLSEIPGGGGGAQKLNELAHEQYTAAVARPAGIEASRITPEVLDQAFTNTGAKFDSVAQAAGEIPLGNFATTGKTVLKDYANLTKEESSVLQNFYDRITNPTPEVAIAGQTNPNAAFTRMSAADFKAMQGGVGQAAPTISGDTYQTIRSQMLAKARQTSNAELKLALGDMRNALDESVQKGLPPKLADAWLAARQEYKNLLIVEKALNRGGEFAPNGLITPAALRQAASSIEKRGFARGQSDYTALAKAGEAVMKTPPQSGTAPRMTAHLIPSAIGGLAGGLLGGAISMPAVTGLIAPALTGRAIMSGLGQRYLGNQFAVPLRQIPLDARIYYEWSAWV